jgi:hypothetical protein
MALSPADRSCLAQLEESMWREDTRFDRRYMERTLAADFFEFGRSGRTYTREEILELARHEIPAQLPLPDLRIRLLDENTAQVTYDSAVRYGTFVEYAHRSSIWSRTAGGWTLRFHQGTPYVPASAAAERAGG